MRPRLVLLLLGLMAVVLLSLGIPLAVSDARAAAQTVFLDRLNDAARFAALARQGVDAENAPLHDELNRYQQVYGIDAVLIGSNGKTVLASSSGFLLPSSRSAALDAAFSGRRPEAPEALWPWSSRRLVIAEPVVSGGDVVGVLVVSSPTDAARADVTRKWIRIAAAEAIAILTCALLALRLTSWILRPVHFVDRVAHDISTGHLEARVPVESGPPELRRLSTSFNAMAESVEGSLEQQRAFVANASHQLRNPLNALLLRLDDVAMRVPPPWAAEADQAAGEGRHLAAMLDELLLLAQAERGHLPVAERADISTLVDERIRVVEPAARAKGVTIRRSGDPNARAVVDRIAICGALDVVLDNAVKFSPADSTIAVTVESERGLSIVVTDSGEGLAPAELDQVGRRFWRSKRHQNVPGSGLGLSIASLLLEPSGSELEIARADTGGLRATLHIAVG